jgi:hypothetical protein
MRRQGLPTREERLTDQTALYRVQCLILTAYLDLRSLGSGLGEGLKPLRDFITASEFEPA